MDLATVLRWAADRYPHLRAVGGARPMTYAECTCASVLGAEPLRECRERRTVIAHRSAEVPVGDERGGLISHREMGCGSDAVDQTARFEPPCPLRLAPIQAELQARGTGVKHQEVFKHVIFALRGKSQPRRANARYSNETQAHTRVP